MHEDLLQQIRACPTLPSLPSIAVQVLELTQKADVDMAEIARLISKDPALSTKILKTVNSSFYGRPKAVSTISQAMVIMGLQSVKTLVLGFSLVNNLSQSHGKGFRHLEYWKRSIYAATAARLLSAKLGMVQQEEAFLSALLNDIGMLVLHQVLGPKYNSICESVSSHSGLAEAERAALGMTHAEVGGFLADQWQLPPLLREPIAHHHTPDAVADPALKKLTQVVAVAGQCADVFVDDSAAEAIVGARQLCASVFALQESDSDALLADIGKKTKEIAGLFEINIGTGNDFEAILKKAKDALIDLTLRSQMEASQLHQQNQQLKAQASTDGLTGLANRAAFDAFLEQKFTEAQSAGKPLSLIMIDIDKFKSVNDSHGHTAGDAVLRSVARLLKALARKGDLAARYGGEEMALILPDTTRQAASVKAETLRRALCARPMPAGSVQLKITASFGVAGFEPDSPLRQASHLLKAADLALYAAKKGGRNTVRLYTPKPASAAA